MSVMCLKPGWDQSKTMCAKVIVGKVLAQRKLSEMLWSNALAIQQNLLAAQPCDSSEQLRMDCNTEN